MLMGELFDIIMEYNFTEIFKPKSSPPSEKMAKESETITPVSEPVPASPTINNEAEIEKGSTKSDSPATTAEREVEAGDLGDYSNVPKLSLLKLFWFFFYNFGIFAWGGPVAQIALIKEKLVIQDKWISLARFQRVFSVYQILPGPEAAELCMFFGCLSAGRVGGILAGLAFMLPGLVLMLLASYLYALAGFENKYFNASFRALQPIVAAMVGIPSAAQTPEMSWIVQF